jgi:2-haloacid dehalogenase
VAALKPVLEAHAITLEEEQILELYAEIEPEVEEGEFVKYREVLRRVVQEIGRRLGFVPSHSEMDCLVKSLKNWMPFPDSVEALKALKKTFRLGVISNVDDDLFALSANHLRVTFDWIITAEQVKSYKPSLCNFRFAIKRIGVAPEKILHVAQSVYHDIIPAKALGLSTVWVNRRRGKEESGATPLVTGHLGLEVPDLKTLVSIMKVDL